MAGAVLDASVLALLFAEPGSTRVRDCLSGGVISAVNVAEVLSKLVDRGMPETTAGQAFGLLGLRVAPFDDEQARRVATLRLATRAFGLPLGDRACLALGAELGLNVITADRSWAGVAQASNVVIIVKQP